MQGGKLSLEMSPPDNRVQYFDVRADGSEPHDTTRTSDTARSSETRTSETHAPRTPPTPLTAHLFDLSTRGKQCRTCKGQNNMGGLGGYPPASGGITHPLTATGARVNHVRLIKGWPSRWSERVSTSLVCEDVEYTMSKGLEPLACMRHA